MNNSNKTRRWLIIWWNIELERDVPQFVLSSVYCFKYTCAACMQSLNVMAWKHHPHYLPFVRGRWIPLVIGHYDETLLFFFCFFFGGDKLFFIMDKLLKTKPSSCRWFEGNDLRRHDAPWRHWNLHLIHISKMLIEILSHAHMESTVTVHIRAPQPCSDDTECYFWRDRDTSFKLLLSTQICIPLNQI